MKLTYTSTFKIFLLIFLCWFSFIREATCQNETEDNNVRDSIRVAYERNPFGIQVGIDILKLGSFALDFETKYEGQLGLSYKALYLIIEAGYGYYASELAYKNSDDYEVEGHYYRAGLDYSFNLGAKNQLLLGLRYGISTFGDKGTFEVSSDLWDPYVASVNRSDAEATWGEAILGTQTDIAKNLHFGWYFRLRKLIDKTTYDPIDIYNIPGYGKSIDSSIPALNLFIKYKLSF